MSSSLKYSVNFKDQEIWEGMLAFLKPQQRGFIALRLLTPKDHSQFSPRKESVTGYFHYYKASGNDYMEKISFKVSSNCPLAANEWMYKLLVMEALAMGENCMIQWKAFLDEERDNPVPALMVLP